MLDVENCLQGSHVELGAHLLMRIGLIVCLICKPRSLIGQQRLISSLCELGLMPLYLDFRSHFATEDYNGV